MTLLLLLACAEPAPPPRATPPVAAESRTPLDAPRLARRISLDLTGVLPSVAALDEIEASPGALDGWMESWLVDRRLEDRLVQLLAERWHTRIDDFQVNHDDYRLGDGEEYAYERAVGEEPLRLVAHVAATDAQWSEIVTAPYTMGNSVLADIWPLTCDAPLEGEDWRVCTYSDARPAAGVLATNGLWWRYTTTPSNLNRARVAALVRLLVCDDILARSITFSTVPALADADAVAAAIREEPACAACHAEIEPVAAALLGFYWQSEYSRIEQDTYHPEREPMGETLLGVSPAWYGTPIAGLMELGPAIAQDPRFEACAVESFASLYWRRDVVDADQALLDEIGSQWDGRYRSLVRAIFESPQYKAGDDSLVDSPERTVRLLSPDQLADVLEALTGYRWTQDGFDQMDNDAYGFRVLAGGVDGEAAVSPQADPGLTWALVVKRLAEAAAMAVAEVDIGGGQGRLLDGVDASTTSEDPAFSEQIRALGWRLYAERISETEVAAWASLWTAMRAEGDAVTAWAGLLSAMFRDPRMVST